MEGGCVVIKKQYKMERFNKIVKYFSIGAISGVLILSWWIIFLLGLLGGGNLKHINICFMKGLSLLTTIIVLKIFLLGAVGGGIISLAISGINKIRGRLLRYICLMFIGALCGTLLGVLFPSEDAFIEIVSTGGVAGAIVGILIFLEVNIISELVKNKNKMIRVTSLIIALLVAIFIVIRLYFVLLNLF